MARVIFIEDEYCDHGKHLDESCRECGYDEFMRCQAETLEEEHGILAAWGVV